MRVRSLSFVVALLLWLASVFEMLVIAIKAARGQIQDTVVHALFSQGTSADHAAPIAILIVFGWLLVELLGHGLRLRRESAAVATIKGWPARALRDMRDNTRAGRRAALVRNLADTPDRLHEALPSQAGVDAANLENAYSMTKTLVWLLPVLGFIGTAWGMAHAIGGFSEALGETADPKILADRLGQKVIPGLSSAFSTTMLALAAAMIAHYCASGLQAVDHEILRQLDEACVTRLAQTPGAQPGGGGGGGGESSANLMHALGMMSNSLNDLVRQTGLKEAGARLTQAGQVLGESATRIRELAELMHRDATLPYQVTIKRGP